MKHVMNANRLQSRTESLQLQPTEIRIYESHYVLKSNNHRVPRSYICKSQMGPILSSIERWKTAQSGR